MAVNIQSYSYAGVPQHLRDYLGADVLSKEQRGARVAQIMKAHLWQPSPLEQRVEEVGRDEAAV